MATLYAQPTKEWVIPAKPKPGRKPKRDDPAVEEDNSSDSKAKKVQNRAAQRAFRERKQSQLADLQARLTQYEQGEIERNVALQNVAKKLKEDNERLKSENEKLREEGDRVREENLSMRNRLRELQEEYSAYRRKMEPNSSHFDPESTIATRKRSRTDSNAALVSVSTPASTSTSSTVAPATKRKRGKDQTRSSTPIAVTRPTITTESRRMSGKGYSTLPPDYAPPPQLVQIYSPATSEGSSGPSLVMSPATSGNSPAAEPASLDDTALDDDDDMSDYTSDKITASGFDSTVTHTGGLHMVDCGFCSKDSDSCVCREVSLGINQLLESTSSPVAAETSILDHAPSSTNNDPATSPMTPRPNSILDNLPPVQPGVPLRRRSKRSNLDAGSINDGGPVHLTPVPQLSKPASRPVCSGDPSNCAACADDPFGRAFCMALASGGVCRDPKCKRCPRPSPEQPQPNEDKGKGKGKAIPMDVDAGSSLGMGMSMETGMLLCCGDPKLCGGGVCGVRAPPSSSPIRPSQRPSLQTASSGSIVQLPQSHTRSDTEEQDRDRVRLPPLADDSDDIPTNDAWERLKSHPNIAFADLSLLADVVAGRTKCTGPRVRLSPTPENEDDDGREEEDDGKRGAMHPPPTLVPHEALVRCGRERLMRVQAEGVRDALAMLDVHRPA